METVDKFYTNYYKNYIIALSKSQEEIATKNDLLGTEDSKLKDIHYETFDITL